MAGIPNSVVLDASAVIEVLFGVGKAKRIESLTVGKTVFLTPAVITEVIAFSQRQGKDPELALRAMLDSCVVVQTSAETAYDTGMFYAVARKKKPKLSFTDASVLAAADMLKARIVTCDNDFSGFPRVIVVR